MKRRLLTGLDAWMVQRFSAIYLLACIVLLCLHFLLDAPTSYEQWSAWVHRPVVTTTGLVFLAALVLHAWVGLRDVILDYVRPLALRVTALALLGAGLAGVIAWAARILLR